MNEKCPLPKLTFKPGTRVLLLQNYEAAPTWDETYQLCSGQEFKVIARDFRYTPESNYLHSDNFSWVRVIGINPKTGKQYPSDFSIESKYLVEATEINRLLYGK